MNSTIVNQAVKHYRRFRTVGRTVSFKINTIPEGEEPVSWVENAVSEIVLNSTQNLEPSDLVGFSFTSQDFARGQGWMPFKEASKVTVGEIFDLIQGIYQSNSSGLDTRTFQLGVTSVRLPKGLGRATTSKYNTFTEECKKRRGIVLIHNDDNLCLPRALVVAQAFVQNDPLYNKICDGRLNLQKNKALELCQLSGVVVPETGCGLGEVQVFQQYLKDFKITVYEYGSKGRNVLFEGPGEGKRLNLLFLKDISSL